MLALPAASPPCVLARLGSRARNKQPGQTSSRGIPPTGRPRLAARAPSPAPARDRLPACVPRPAWLADETALRGRPEVFVTGGFNRWTHPGEERQASNCMPPGRHKSSLLTTCLAAGDTLPPSGLACQGRPRRRLLSRLLLLGAQCHTQPCRHACKLTAPCHSPGCWPLLQRSLLRCRCRAWSRAALAGTRPPCRSVTARLAAVCMPSMPMSKTRAMPAHLLCNLSGQCARSARRSHFPRPALASPSRSSCAACPHALGRCPRMPT